MRVAPAKRRKRGRAAELHEVVRRDPLTGALFSVTTGGRGRPREHVNTTARILTARISEVESLLHDLMRGPNAVLWDPANVRKLRAHLWYLANALGAAPLEGGGTLRPAPGRKLGGGTSTSTKAATTRTKRPRK